MKKRKPIITVDGMRIISLTAGNYAAWCWGCGREVELITFAEAGKIAGIGIDGIINYAAAGNLHFGISPAAMLICLESLKEIDFRKPTNYRPAQTRNR